MGRRDKPVINSNNYNSRPLTDIRADRVLGVDVPQHPTTTMHIQHNAISAFGSWFLRREYSHKNIRSVSFNAFDGDILCFTDWKNRTAAGDQDAGCARGGDGLEVDLLLVDDVFVVEGGVFGVDARGDGGMEGVGGLSYACHFVCLLLLSRCIYLLTS